MSVETESSSSKGDFRAPKLDSLSESPSQGASLCSLNISLYECYYSAFVKLTVWARANSWHVPKGEERKGKEGRLSHWDYAQRNGQGSEALMQGTE